VWADLDPCAEVIRQDVTVENGGVTSFACRSGSLSNTRSAASRGRRTRPIYGMIMVNASSTNEPGGGHGIEDVDREQAGGLVGHGDHVGLEAGHDSTWPLPGSPGSVEADLVAAHAEAPGLDRLAAAVVAGDCAEGARERGAGVDGDGALDRSGVACAGRAGEHCRIDPVEQAGVVGVRRVGGPRSRAALVALKARSVLLSMSAFVSELFLTSRLAAAAVRMSVARTELLAIA
jgi:hypothetical protein